MPVIRLLCLLVAVVVLSEPSHAGALCRPDFSFRDVMFSPAQGLQRTWTAVVKVDASRCAAWTGRAEIAFVRLKENAKDLEFNEPFTWVAEEEGTGVVEVSVDFWIDEAVLSYSIGYAAPCGCRQ